MLPDEYRARFLLILVFGQRMIIIMSRSHRPAELKSMALHQEISLRLHQDPDPVLKKAKANLLKLRQIHGYRAEQYCVAWEHLMDGPIETLIETFGGRPKKH